MFNPFIRNLEAFGPLPDGDRQALKQVLGNTQQVDACRDLVREGVSAEECYLVLEGLAFRHRTLGDGKRQIMGFEIAGDLCDLHGFLLGGANYSITALTACTVVLIPHAALREWTNDRPSIALALWRTTLVDASVSREWIVNVGSRTAFQRTAHLLCEIAQRLHLAGLADEHVCTLPLTHLELADALGLTSVHVSRNLQWLRSHEMITFSDRAATMLNWRELKEIAGFSPAYLH